MSEGIYSVVLEKGHRNETPKERRAREARNDAAVFAAATPEDWARAYAEMDRLYGKA